MAKQGIDVSEWQGDIDFERVKADGIQFVIIRAGYGSELSQKDRYFEQNYTRAKAAGLEVGAYWYSYAHSVEQAKAEARICKQAIAGKQFEYPIFFDLEEQSQLSQGRAFCDSLIRTFCDEMEAGGYYAGFYASASVAQSVVSQTLQERYAFWCAQWGSSNSLASTSGLWQYSATGQISGVSGNVDMNYGYIDYPSIIKNGGFNGYSAANGQGEQSTAYAWHKDDAGWWYGVKNGWYAKNGWQKVGDEWYAFDNRGYMIDGWYENNGKLYYLDTTRGNWTGEEIKVEHVPEAARQAMNVQTA